MLRSDWDFKDLKEDNFQFLNGLINYSNFSIIRLFFFKAIFIITLFLNDYLSEG